MKHQNWRVKQKLLLIWEEYPCFWASLIFHSSLRTSHLVKFTCILEDFWSKIFGFKNRSFSSIRLSSTFRASKIKFATEFIYLIKVCFENLFFVESDLFYQYYHYSLEKVLQINHNISNIKFLIEMCSLETIYCVCDCGCV